MLEELNNYNQYKKDFFQKLNYIFIKGSSILDIGCGDGIDSSIFINVYRLNTYGIDIYKHNNIKNVKGLKFKKGNILNIPFKDNYFDNVFTHDVLHHIDEKNQSKKFHVQALKEIKRVCKNRGNIIIAEANRYNPLFYPHMVLMKKHNHFQQIYFLNIIREIFPKAKFHHFEAHLYPNSFLRICKLYEKIMERYQNFKPFLAYNIAIINK